MNSNVSSHLKFLRSKRHRPLALSEFILSCCKMRFAEASARLTSRAAFEDAGARAADFKRQIAALIDFGAVQLLELFMQKSGEKGYLNALLQFNHLRAEFGEKFKMIKFKKGL